MEKTEIQIEQLRADFVKWLDEEQSILCGDKDIVRTADTVKGFLNACLEYKDTYEEDMNGMPVTIIVKSQRHKGEPRKDLYILDADEHTRLVYVS